MIEKKLPSGATLKFDVAPFAEAKALYQAVLEEARDIKIDGDDEVGVNLFKDIFATAISSKKIEACVTECLRRALYNGEKVSDDTFEPVEARQDYIPACFEVAKENISPFAKSLYAELLPEWKNLREKISQV